MATGKTEENIKVLFFAQFREQLDCQQLSLESSSATDINNIKQLLSERGDIWRQVFSGSSMLVAVNQQMVQGNVMVTAGDEVAFFPPVTGG